MALSAALLKKLVQIPVFAGLSTAEAQEFFEVALEQHVEANRPLFEEGSEGDALLVILEGEVRVTKKDVELAKLGAHSVLGEMSLVGHDERRSASASTLTPVRLLTIPSKRVKRLLKADNLAALKVVANIAVVLGRRLSVINDRLVASMTGSKRREELAHFGKILKDWSF